jgi:replicative DNA helicase
MASVQASVIEPDITIAGIVDEADAALVAAVERREATPQISAGDGMQAVLARIEAIQRGEVPAGVMTGINDIDALLGGFEPGQLVILAGRPGMGKTAVAGSIATGCAKAGAGTLFISLEMSTGELSARMLADAAFNGTRGIDFGRIIGATVSCDEMRELARLTTDHADLPLTIVDVGSMTVSRLALGIRRHKRRFAARGHDLKLVVIDYLQLLRTDEKHRSVYEAVSEISRALKGLAKDCGVTILALAQLNRGVEGREDKRPGLSDIRDSGQIEQDADAVLFLHREEYYLARNKPKKADQLDAWEQACADAAGRIDFILAKRRNGPAGLSRRGYFFSHYQAVRGSDLYGDRP